MNAKQPSIISLKYPSKQESENQNFGETENQNEKFEKTENNIQNNLTNTLNLREVQISNAIMNQDIQLQLEADNTIINDSNSNDIAIKDSKRRLKIIISSIGVAVVVLIVLLAVFLTKQESNMEEKIVECNFECIQTYGQGQNLIQIKHEPNYTRQFSLEVKNIQSNYLQDGKFSQSQFTTLYDIRVLCQNVTKECKIQSFDYILYVNSSKTYDTQNQSNFVEQPGSLDFLNQQIKKRRFLEEEPIQDNSIPSIDNEAKQDMNNSDIRNDQSLPFNENQFEMSSQEILSFKIKKTGEPLEVTFSVNVNAHFMNLIPQIIQTISPTLLQDNYLQKDHKNKRILEISQTSNRFQGSGQVEMNEMVADIKDKQNVLLTQGFSQDINSLYQQKSQYKEQTNFREGKLTNASVQSDSTFGNNTDKSDLFRNIILKQEINLVLLSEYTVSEHEYEQVIAVYDLMVKLRIEWDNLPGFFQQIRKSNYFNSDGNQQSNSNQIQDINSQINNNNGTRILSENENLMQEKRIKIFKQSILTIQLETYLLIKCVNQQDQNDECSIKLMLDFLGNSLALVSEKKGNLLNEFFNQQNQFLYISIFSINQAEEKYLMVQRKFYLICKLLKQNNKCQKLIEQFIEGNTELNEQVEEIIEEIFRSVNPQNNQILYQLISTKDLMVETRYQTQEKIMNQLSNILQVIEVNSKSIFTQISQEVDSFVYFYLNQLRSLLPLLRSELNKLLKSLYDIMDTSNSFSQQEIDQIKQISLLIKQSKSQIFDTPLKNVFEGLIEIFQSKLSQNEIIMNDTIKKNLRLDEIYLSDPVQSSLINEYFQKEVIQMLQQSIFEITTKQYLVIIDTLTDKISNTKKSLNQYINENEISLDSIIKDLDLKIAQSTNISNDNQNNLSTYENLSFELSNLIDLYGQEISFEDNFKNVQNQFDILDILNNDIPIQIKSINEQLQLLTKTLTVDLEQQILQLKQNQNQIVQEFKQILNSKVNQMADKFLSVNTNSEGLLNQMTEYLGAQITDSNDIQKELKDQLSFGLDESQFSNFSLEQLFGLSLQSQIPNLKANTQKVVTDFKNKTNKLNNYSQVLQEMMSYISKISTNPFDILELNEIRIPSYYSDITIFECTQLFNQFKDFYKLNQIDMMSITEDTLYEEINSLGNSLFQKQIFPIGLEKIPSLSNTIIDQIFKFDPILESSTSKIISLFKSEKIKILNYQKQMTYPLVTTTFIIPTPIGIPLVLDYKFVFNFSLESYLQMTGFSFDIGLLTQLSCEINSEAYLSVVIANAGVQASGVLADVSLDTNLKFTPFPTQQGQIIVIGSFKALSAYIKFEMKCFSIDDFRMRNLNEIQIKNKLMGSKRNLSLFDWFYDALQFVKKIVKSISKAVSDLIKNLEICIPIPIKTYSDKIPIFPPLKLQYVYDISSEIVNETF